MLLVRVYFVSGAAGGAALGNLIHFFIPGKEGVKVKALSRRVGGGV
jgi:hypothetical protein